MSVRHCMRIAATLLAFMVLACLFVGCSAKSSSSASAERPSSAIASTASTSVGASAGISAGASASSASSAPSQPSAFRLSDVAPYTKDLSVAVNGNVPYFSQADLAREPFEQYSPLDELGRCGTAFALVGRETMPTGERGSIGMIKPSGWQTTRYDWVDGNYLFNRCHLIAYALAGENDNELNLITGTRTMNAQGMLPYEERVAAYIDRTGNHVLYRVTPVFEGDNLVASGVLIEALSVEDDGAGIQFCTWCYNVEPGVAIDYATGASEATGDAASSAETAGQEAAAATAVTVISAGGAEPAAEPDTASAYILNTNTHRFHYPDCSGVAAMAEHNKQPFNGTRDEAIALGYQPCGICKP